MLGLQLVKLWTKVESDRWGLGLPGLTVADKTTALGCKGDEGLQTGCKENP